MVIVFVLIFSVHWLTIISVSHSFQKALKEYGVSDVDVFQTVDLYEKNKDFPSVINCLYALGREVRIHSPSRFKTI